MTACYRSRPETFDPTSSSAPYSTVLGFGNINPEMTDMVNGVFLAVYETGPWLAMKATGDPAYSWLGYGEHYFRDLQVWRHSCFALDFTNGATKLVENGKKVFEGNSKDLIKVGKSLNGNINFVSVGCYYRPEGPMGYMSMVGSVTDAQIFGRILDDQEMMKMTSCTSFLVGDVLSWATTAWILRGQQNLSIKEEMELDKDVCQSRETSLHLVPYAMNYKYSSLDVCSKLSGEIAGYVTQADLEKKERFLSTRNILRSENCLSETKGGNTVLRVWLAGSDEEEEGRWRTWYTDQDIEYLPWAPARPYDGGTEYNCLELEMELEDRRARMMVVKKAEVEDEECSMKYCVLCEVKRPALEIHVRGLCQNSMFDRTYLYNIGENGLPILRGKTTSVIQFDVEQKMWIWFDRRDNQSQARSLAPENSLLLGVHKIDFSSVVKNPCGGPVLDIKLSTCSAGEFTCNNGQCIDLERRCDQTVNCKDESDEDHCKMIFMKDNYNKKISAFKYDEKTKENIPVSVKISMDIKKILKIEEVNHVFSVKFRLVMEWYDHRLNYYNLKEQRSSNSLSLKEVEKLWIPYIVFENSENSEATKSDPDSEVLITREGGFTSSGEEVIEERNIFLGSKNRITFQQVFTKEFECEYQLQLYPFDTQVLCYAL